MASRSGAFLAIRFALKLSSLVRSLVSDSLGLMLVSSLGSLSWSFLGFLVMRIVMMVVKRIAMIERMILVSVVIESPLGFGYVFLLVYVNRCSGERGVGSEGWINVLV